jgi:thioredoxin 1
MSIPTGQHVREVTDADFAEQVLGADQPVLVEYWATWCGPCRMVAPVLAELADEHADQWRVVKMDIDANPATARDQRIMSVPNMILYRNGEAVASLVGARGKAAVWRSFEPYL